MVRSMPITLNGAPSVASRFLIGLVTCLDTHDGIPALPFDRLATVGAGRHGNEVGETGAEGAERRAAHGETDVGDAEITASQEGHGALDAPGHEVAVGRFAVSEPKLTAEVSGRHVRIAGQRLDVEWLDVVSIDPVSRPAQLDEVAEVLSRGTLLVTREIMPCGGGISGARVVAAIQLPAGPVRTCVRLDRRRGTGHMSAPVCPSGLVGAAAVDDQHLTLDMGVRPNPPGLKGRPPSCTAWCGSIAPSTRSVP